MFGSRSKPKPKLEPRCRHCRAPNDLDAPECWLCQRRDWRGAGVRTREAAPLPERSPFATIAGLPGPAGMASGRPARPRRPGRPISGTPQESTGGLVWFALIYAATWLVNLWPRSAPTGSLSLALVAVAAVVILYLIFSPWRRQ
jgi:hypothetical protein